VQDQACGWRIQSDAHPFDLQTVAHILNCQGI
jgi:hypothetical protein